MNTETPAFQGSKVAPKTVRPEASHRTYDRTDDMINSVFHEARTAQRAIRGLSIDQRLAIVKDFQKIILLEKENLVIKLQEETGKSRTDALASEIFGISDAIAWLTNHGRAALSDEKVPTPLTLLGKVSKIYYEPRGTVLVITPWNYPLYQAVIPSLFSFVAGNATIIKPSEYTPMQGLIEKLLSKSQFPTNAIQVLYGDGEVGAKAIAAKPDYISFTGSVATGKRVMELASRNLIPVELELGSKDPMIVFDDIDLGRTVAGAVWGSFTNAGQSCTSVERIYVQDTIYEKFIAAFLQKTRELVTNDTNPLNVDMGKMTVLAQAEKVHNLVKDAAAKGANVLIGGKWDGQSFDYPATVITNVTPEMLITQEEIFGPVVVVDTFHTEDEAVAKANDSEFGLSASVWTKDLARADRVTRKLETGCVSINNVMLTEGNTALPFGGTKNSGIGRIKGTKGLQALCNVKSVIVDKQSKKIEANWYPYTTKKYHLFGSLLNFFLGGAKGLMSFALAGLALESHAQKPRQPKA